MAIRWFLGSELTGAASRRVVSDVPDSLESIQSLLSPPPRLKGGLRSHGRRIQPPDYCLVRAGACRWVFDKKEVDLGDYILSNRQCANCGAEKACTSVNSFYLCLDCLKDLLYTGCRSRCDSESTNFTIKNTKIGDIRSDTIYKMPNKKGEISSAGVTAIINSLNTYASTLRYPDSVTALPLFVDGDIEEHLEDMVEWVQTSNEGGSIVKRIAALYRRRKEHKLPEYILNEIGDIAGKSVARNNYNFMLTGRFNRHPALFSNQGSCWWGGYWASLCHVKQNHTFAFLLFDEECYAPLGRAWVQPIHGSGGYMAPLKQATGFVLYNGYGPELNTLSSYFASLVGKPYKNVYYSIESSNSDDSIYVNDNNGYLVADVNGLNSITHYSERVCDCHD